MMWNSRGTHGSGKTTISHRLIDEHPHTPLIEPDHLEGTIRSGKKAGEPYSKNFKKANAFHIPSAPGGEDLFVVGRYQAGLDGFLPHETIEDMIRYWAPRGHLVFENVLLSANIGRWGTLFEELMTVNPVLMAYIDTPWETCAARVMQRRAEARARGWKHRQRDEDVKVHVHEAHWKRCRRVAGRAFTAGFDVRWVDHNLAYEIAHDELVRAGWNCPVHRLLGAPSLPEWHPTAEDLERLQATCLLPWEHAPVPPRLPEDGDLSSLPVLDPAILSAAPVTSTIPPDDPFTDIGDLFDC